MVIIVDMGWDASAAKGNRLKRKKIIGILWKTFQRDIGHPYCALSIQEWKEIIFICKFNINESDILFEVMPIAKCIRKKSLLYVHCMVHGGPLMSI